MSDTKYHEADTARSEPSDGGFEELLRAAVQVEPLDLPVPQPTTLRGGRLQIVRRLGEGGMGVVYEAIDRDRGKRVALKTLSRLSPSGSYRLKREFRSLCHVVHPNLVALHELFFDRDQWFFTMDLVHGESFTSYCEARRGGPAPIGTAATGQPWFLELLRQLLSGVAAIHEAGKLHRDLKPSNVLITEQRDQPPRVVILDFGLVADQALASNKLSSYGLPGTPAYIAPEQAAGDAASPKSDLYAVGVILYQALTGRLPFDGPPLKLLSDKQRRDPRPPSLYAAALSPRLSALCMRLLSRDPRDRPDCAAALRWLAPAAPRSVAAGAAGGGTVESGASSERFVGRHAQLLALSRAFARSRTGRPLVVLVRGSSGMGKTELVRHFVDGLSHSDAALVLRSRCYEREAVPFKAFDGIVDELSHYLARQPRHEAAALLPRDIHSLGRVFPALLRAEPVLRAAGRIAADSDPQMLRQRAFRALKEMLQRLSDRRPVVLFIDDLQYSDVDSARLLEEIVSPPDPPPLLLIGCYRREEAESSRFLRQVLRGPRRLLSPEELYRVRVSSMLRAEVAAGLAISGDPPQAQPEEIAELGVDDLTLRALTEVRELTVDRLQPREAAALAGALLTRAGLQPADALSDTIARESEGVPLYVHELVRHVCSGAYDRPAHGMQAHASLDQMLGARIDALPQDARDLVDAVAVAGRPIGQDLALRAAGLTPGDVRTLQLLRGQGLVRTRGAAATDPIEVYHDRVARVVHARMSPETVPRVHGRVAITLERAGAASPQWLAELFHGAGDSERAARYAMQAAAQARGSLAFSRAQQLSRWSLSLFRTEEAYKVRQGAVIGAAIGAIVGSVLASLAVAYFKADHAIATKLGIYFMGAFGGGPLGMMLGSVARVLSLSDPERTIDSDQAEVSEANSIRTTASEASLGAQRRGGRTASRAAAARETPSEPAPKRGRATGGRAPRDGSTL